MSVQGIKLLNWIWSCTVIQKVMLVNLCSDEKELHVGWTVRLTFQFYWGRGGNEFLCRWLSLITWRSAELLDYCSLHPCKIQSVSVILVKWIKEKTLDRSYSYYNHVLQFWLTEWRYITLELSLKMSNSPATSVRMADTSSSLYKTFMRCGATNILYADVFLVEMLMTFFNI